MPCFSPVDVPRKGYTDLRITVACGRCIGCRLDRQRDTAIRCVHEAQLHEHSCFATLTYDAEHLPPGGSLRPRDFTLFMKRLRHARPGQTVRYLQCGEYGSNLERPHHHALLFGVFFPDRKLIPGTLEKGKPRWTSRELCELWGQGERCDIGVLNQRTAAYTAGYLLKRITGDLAESHYRVVDPSTGEVFQRHPEYSTRSTKPGLGSGFLDRFVSDIYPRDFCATVDGRQVPPPVYYDKLLEREDPELFKAIKARRFAYAMEPRQQANCTPERLEVRETVKRSALSLRSKSL